MSEAAITRRILAAIKSTPEAKAIKIHGSGYSEAGTPDIIGAYKGRMFLVEVKAEKGRATLLQLHRLEEWKDAGAVAVIAGPEFDTAAFMEGLA